MLINTGSPSSFKSNISSKPAGLTEEGASQVNPTKSGKLEKISLPRFKVGSLIRAFSSCGMGGKDAVVSVNMANIQSSPDGESCSPRLTACRAAMFSHNDNKVAQNLLSNFKEVCRSSEGVGVVSASVIETSEEMYQANEKYHSSISQEESSALGIYMMTGFGVMNRMLRSDSEFYQERPESRNQWMGTILTADLALSKCQKNEELRYSGTVFRGALLPESELNSLTVGGTYRDHGFFSTSKSEMGVSQLTFVVESKTGVDVHDLSRFPTEEEVLFRPETGFTIDQIEKHENGRTIIRMTEQDSQPLPNYSSLES